MKSNRVFWCFVAIELVLIGILLGSLTTTGIDTSIAPHGQIEYVLNRYQTLITGAAALVAAYWTTGTIWRQIRASELQHAEDRFRALAGELDALEGLVEYFDRIETIRPYVIKNGRSIFEPPLNLLYRVSMHTSHKVSNRFSELVKEIEAYNQSDRAAERMYGGPDDGSTRHSALTMELTGSIKALSDFARERIAAIRAHDPSAKA